MLLKILYPCDPKKNVTCTKRACDLELCTQTTHAEYAKDNYTYEDVKVIDIDSNTEFKLSLEEKDILEEE